METPQRIPNPKHRKGKVTKMGDSDKRRSKDLPHCLRYALLEKKGGNNSVEDVKKKETRHRGDVLLGERKKNGIFPSA